jgi:hypothetical protein
MPLAQPDQDTRLSVFAIICLFWILIAAPALWSHFVRPLRSASAPEETFQLSKDEIGQIKRVCQISPPLELTLICKRLGEAK